MWALLRGRWWNRRAVAGLGAYVIVAVLTVALFIAAHVAGNRLPYDLAVERLAEEFRATTSDDWGARGGVWIDKWHYCEFNGIVLAGARAEDDGNALRHAILLHVHPNASGSRGGCDDLKAAVLQGVWLAEAPYANLRQWFITKAIYAIALRYITVREFHLVIKVLVYCGFLSLAAALLLLRWRAFVVCAPLLIFGIFLSDVESVLTLSTGLPFAWAFFATALGAVLLRHGRSPSTARLFFFFAGMVSHGFFLFDGGNIVAATLIGLVVWLAREADSPLQRVGCAATCVGVYTAGFVASLAFRITMAISLLEDRAFARVLGSRAEVLWNQVLVPSWKELASHDVGNYQILVRLDAPTFEWLVWATVAALFLAASIGSYRAWRNRALLFDMLWFGALFLPFLCHMLLPQDSPLNGYRTMFLPLGLGWCFLFAVLTNLPRRQFAGWTAGVGAALASSYGAMHLTNQWEFEAKLAKARLVSASQENGAFAVYLLDAATKEGGKVDVTPKTELIYWRSPCSSEDLLAEFFVHALAPAARLPEGSRERGFANAGFSFYQNGQIFLGTCYASVRLPDYAEGVRVGQSFYVRGGSEDGSLGGTYRTVWQLEIDLPKQNTSHTGEVRRSDEAKYNPLSGNRAR